MPCIRDLLRVVSSWSPRWASFTEPTHQAGFCYCGACGWSNSSIYEVLSSSVSRYFSHRTLPVSPHFVHPYSALNVQIPSAHSESNKQFVVCCARISHLSHCGVRRYSRICTTATIAEDGETFSRSASLCPYEDEYTWLRILTLRQDRRKDGQLHPTTPNSIPICFPVVLFPTLLFLICPATCLTPMTFIWVIFVPNTFLRPLFYARSDNIFVPSVSAAVCHRMVPCRIPLHHTVPTTFLLYLLA